MSTDPYQALGAFLTAYEAEQLATALQGGDTLTQALKEIHTSRRDDARRLLASANLGPHRVDVSAAMLRAVAGARGVHTSITPVWTMPGAEATVGRLTSEARRIINDARMSIVCSSFNFSRYSWMWDALHTATNRPGVSVTIYLDGRVGTATTVAQHLPRATVYRTTSRPGHRQRYVSHAKFLVVDRALTLVTSANLSYPAEHTNIELGLLVHDAAMATSIESLMRSKHGVLYERVAAG